eukprot:scaffold78306_cov18-Tisochrysis_lutea.AAC.1
MSLHPFTCFTVQAVVRLGCKIHYYGLHPEFAMPLKLETPVPKVLGTVDILIEEGSTAVSWLPTHQISVLAWLDNFLITLSILHPHCKVLMKSAKQRKDSIESYKSGGRQDLVDKEAKEVRRPCRT